MTDSRAGAPTAAVQLPIPTQTPSPPPQIQSTSEAFQGPLSVIIQSPADNTVIPVSPVLIKGQADPDTVITLNDAIILVDEQRSFQVELTLEPGANLVEITASDSEGNQGYAFMTLVYEP